MAKAKETKKTHKTEKDEAIKFGYIKPRPIVQEMQESYLDYAMSVIVSRALPDVRDGLKPVHRRILYTMWTMGLRAGAKFRKSAAVVGDCLGKLHPHGDIAVYDSLTRLAQDFSMRYPLVKGQGNFGCFTKDTKVKLTDGRNINFGELIKEQKNGKKHWTFSFNHQTKKIEIAEIKNPRLTKKSEKIIEIALDNGEKIKCTLNHRFLLRNGNYKEAKELKNGNSLMPIYSNIKSIRSHYRYFAVLQPFTGRYDLVHRLADEYNERIDKNVKTIQPPYVLHHKDFNKFNNSPENIERLTPEQHYQIHLRQAKNLWKEKGDKFREKHSINLKKYFSKPEIRKELSVRTKKLWQDYGYRAKYPKDHFRMMAETLWENPAMQEFHREKIARQRQDEKFRKKHIEGVQKSNRRRLTINPAMLKELTKKAKISLRQNWKSSLYKKEVTKSKILGYVCSLLNKCPRVTPQIYEEKRTNNGVPKINNALNYFNNFSEIIKQSQKYNHKIVGVKILRKKEDVYDITVGPWHNFSLACGVFVHNSVDGDAPAAQRYTEAKLSRISEEILYDLEKETVKFIDNYDVTQQEPSVLPAKLPNILLNGSMGIAVGMATNIPPHNLTEVVDGIIHLIDNSDATVEDLVEFIKGPDFPTAGYIFNKKEIAEVYKQGKGAILMRGKAEIVEAKKDFYSIIISEIPYQVNKAEMIEHLANLVRDKKFEGIRDIRDESDKDGIRVVIELKREAFPKKVLNQLYASTRLQEKFHVNMLALVDGIQPRVLNLKNLLECYINHRKEVVTKRAEFDLRKAKERAHILEGLKKAIDHISEIIRIIRQSKDRDAAAKNLIKRFKFSAPQTQAILEMKLSQLAALERLKIEEELKEKKKLIKELMELLGSPKKILGVVKKELIEIKEKYGDERRTKIVAGAAGEFTAEDLIPDEQIVVTLTRGGYIKSLPDETYRAQKRGGKGVKGMEIREEDVIDHCFAANSHANVLFFTNSGKVFQLKAYEIPKSSRTSKGQSIVNFLQLNPEEHITAIVPIEKKTGAKFLAMVTKNAVIKKVELNAFDNVRHSGLIAIKIKSDDELKWVKSTSGEDDIILITALGQSIRFKEKNIRAMGRQAAGVRGMKLKGKDKIIGMDVIEAKNKNQKVIILTENGYGKQSDLKFYKVQGRGGSGIKTVKVTPKNGQAVFGQIMTENIEELIIISKHGQVIRIDVKAVSDQGRATQGVRIMRLDPKDKIASVASI